MLQGRDRHNVIAGFYIGQYCRKNSGCATVEYQAVFRIIQRGQFFS